MDDELDQQPVMMEREEAVPLEAERLRMTAAEPRIGVAEEPEFRTRVGVAEQPFEALTPTQSTPRVGVAEQPFEALTPTQSTPRVGVVEQPFEALTPTQSTPRIGVAEQPFEALTPTQSTPRVGVAEQPFEALTPTQSTPWVGALQPTEVGRAVDAQPLDLTAAQPVEQGRLRDSISPLQPRIGVTAMPQQAGQPMTQADALQPMQGRRVAVDGIPASARQPAGGGGGGSAGSGFQVDPAQYQAAVSPMLAAADQISQLVTNLTGFLSSMESNKPWGNDESGKQFAEGDKGYLKYSADTQKSLKGLPDGLHFIADGLKAMAQGYQNADDSAVSDLNQDDQQLQAGPAMPLSPTIPGSPTLPIPPRATLGDIAHGKNR